MRNFKKIILNNGIPLYLLVDPSMKRVFVSYNLKYGSSGQWFNFKNNGQDYSVGNGYAHYLEHLLEEHSKYGNLFTRFNGRYQKGNAYTGSNETSYHFNGKDNVEKSIEELITSIDNPIFDQKDVDATRHAIEEESASWVDDTSNQLYGLLGRNLYGGFELFDETLSPIGNRETTKQITKEDLYNCYNAFYTDDNKYIIICGNVDEKKIVNLLNSTYSKISPHKTNLELPSLDFDSIRSQNEVIDGNLDIPKVGLGMKFKKTDSVSLRELQYVLRIIKNNLLNSNELRELEKKGLYNNLDFAYMTTTGDNINYSFGFISNKKNDLIASILELLSKKEITKEEYELARKALIAIDLRDMEDKYNYIKYLPMSFDLSEDYSNCDFYKSIDYNRFMEIVSSLDFSNYTVGEIKKLNK